MRGGGGGERWSHPALKSGVWFEAGWCSSSTTSGSWMCSTDRPTTRRAVGLWRAMVQHGMQRAQAAAQARQRRFCALARDRADGAANTEPQPNASAGISERPLEEEEEKKEREPSHVFPKKSRVEYSDGKGEWQAATVVAVAYDDELVEYYEVNLDSWEDSARSKSTIGQRLRWPATKEAVEVVEEGGGRWDDSMAEEVAEVVVEEVKVPQERAESGGSVSDRVGGRRDRGVDEAFTRGVLPSSSSLAAAAAAPVDPSPVSPPSLRPSPTHPTGASSSESSEPGAETAEGGKGGGDGGAVGGVVKGAAKSPATKAAPSSPEMSGEAASSEASPNSALSFWQWPHHGA